MTIKNFIFNPIQVNTYLLYDQQKNGLIIDPGCCTLKEQQEIQQFISDENIQLKKILNTHLHFDHSMGNGFIEKNYHIGTYAHINDEYWLEKMQAYAVFFGLNNSFEAIEKLSGYLNDNEEIYLGEIQISILHVPGHSPGSIAFYLPKQQILFSGDSLFKGSIGRTDLEGGSYKELMNSLQERIMSLPDETSVYPGHGPMTSIKEERTSNPYLYL